jgi:hypothetical protein
MGWLADLTAGISPGQPNWYRQNKMAHSNTKSKTLATNKLR